MTYLLDVNLLLALAHVAHPGHARAEQWLVSQPATADMASCSITELGFVRVSVNAKLCGSIAEAKALLAAMLTAGRFTRLVDDIGADSLPVYVTKAKDTTDGHLLVLAQRRGAKLATFDAGIPGAEHIS